MTAAIKWPVAACALALLLVLFSWDAYAQGPSQAASYSEEEAQSIDRMLLCPVCPAESIDQAQVPIARQMRAVVRKMLGEGASREEVLDFFEARYGTGVLAAPPKSGVNLLAWLLPIVGIVAAMAVGFLHREHRRMLVLLVGDAQPGQHLVDVFHALQQFFSPSQPGKFPHRPTPRPPRGASVRSPRPTRAAP